MRLACQQLVENTLVPTAADMQEEVQKKNSAEEVWQALIKGATNPMAFPNKQLTAYALFDGSRRDRPAGGCSIHTAGGTPVVRGGTPVVRALQFGSHCSILNAIVLPCKDSSMGER